VNAALLTACSLPLQAVQNRVACISQSKGPKNDAELKCVSARGRRTRSARRKSSKHAHGRVGSWAKKGLQHGKRAANQRSESIKKQTNKGDLCRAPLHLHIGHHARAIKLQIHLSIALAVHQPPMRCHFATFSTMATIAGKDVDLLLGGDP